MIEKNETYLYFNCSKSLCRVNLTKLSTSTIIEEVVNYLEENMPIYMSHIVVVVEEKKRKNSSSSSQQSSKLYLVGGDKLIEGMAGYHKFIVNEPDRIFAYRPSSSTTNPFYLDDSIAKMRASKTEPIAVTFDNKTYVFASVRYGCNEEKSVPVPTFEVYDHFRNSWEDLPEPPLYLGPYRAHFVFNRTIYFKSFQGFISYNVDTKVWTHTHLPMVPVVPLHGLWNPELPPLLGYESGHVVEFGGYLIAYTNINKLVAYTSFDSDKNAYTTCRVLDEINELFVDEGMFWHCSLGFVFHLGNGTMCFVLSGLMPGVGVGEYSLRVSTFQFDTTGGPSVVLTNRSFKPTEIPFPSWELRDAFIIKHELDCNPLDSLGKRSRYW